MGPTRLLPDDEFEAGLRAGTRHSGLEEAEAVSFRGQVGLGAGIMAQRNPWWGIRGLE
jgi:hypothetical protein